MQFRKYIGVIVSLLLIAAILLLFADPWSTIRKESRQISLQDRKKIDRIVISGHYDSTLLLRRGDRWLISGEEPVNPVAVENLIYAAERLQISSIYPDAREWDSGTVRSVRFYNGDKPLLRYELKSIESRLMVRPYGAEQVFIVSLPGYAGLDLDRVFSSASNHYREHLLIDLLPSEILHIEVERRDEQPFRFSMDDRGEISCLLPRLDSTVSPEILDDLSIRLLFSYFTSIRYEETAGSVPAALTDPSRGGVWLARLYVESRQGEIHTLWIYSLPDGEGTGTDMFRALVVHNNDPRALVINYIYLDVLMRDLSHYFAG